MKDIETNGFILHRMMKTFVMQAMVHFKICASFVEDKGWK